MGLCGNHHCVMRAACPGSRVSGEPRELIAWLREAARVLPPRRSWRSRRECSDYRHSDSARQGQYDRGVGDRTPGTESRRACLTAANLLDADPVDRFPEQPYRAQAHPAPCCKAATGEALRGTAFESSNTCAPFVIRRDMSLRRGLREAQRNATFAVGATSTLSGLSHDSLGNGVVANVNEAGGGLRLGHEHTRSSHERTICHPSDIPGQ